MITVGKSLADYTFEELEALDKNILTNEECEQIRENPLVTLEILGRSTYRRGRIWIDVHIENEERQCNIDVYVQKALVIIQVLLLQKILHITFCGCHSSQNDFRKIKNTTNKYNNKRENKIMKLLNEFTIDGKKYCTVRTKGGVSVVEKWEYNNAVNRYMKNGGRMK